MTDSENSITRRDFLKMVGAAAVGAAAGQLPDLVRNYEDPDLSWARDIIKRTETIADVEAAQNVTVSAAIAYIHLTERGKLGLEEKMGRETKDLLAKTLLCVDEATFVDAVQKAEKNFGWEPRDYDTLKKKWGTHVNGEVFINLKNVSEASSEYTNHPGVFLASLLIHEWKHLETDERHEGRYLNGVDFLKHGTEKIKQPYSSYDGGRIRTKSGSKLRLFDEAWVELVAVKLMDDFVGDDKKLRPDVVAYHANGLYQRPAVRLRMLVDRADIPTVELWRMHKDSDLEGLLTKIGSLFDDRALNDVYPHFKEDRSYEQITEDKDWIIGQHVAFMIHDAEYEEHRVFMQHLKGS